MSISIRTQILAAALGVFVFVMWQASQATSQEHQEALKEDARVHATLLAHRLDDGAVAVESLMLDATRTLPPLTQVVRRARSAMACSSSPRPTSPTSPDRTYDPSLLHRRPSNRLLCDRDTG
ncbi:MAG: hypothetical protein FJW21_10540 [Acidimicrobiia bacterium]|nr:hypothetical protein [Acidimicrobiia bacterium]